LAASTSAPIAVVSDADADSDADALSEAGALDEAGALEVVPPLEPPQAASTSVLATATAPSAALIVRVLIWIPPRIEVSSVSVPNGADSASDRLTGLSACGNTVFELLAIRCIDATGS